MNLGQYIASKLLEDEQPLDERKYQNQDDTFADYVLSKEADVEATAQEFNIPIPDVRYAFTVGNMVVLTDAIWNKLENKDHKDEEIEIDGPAMILNYDTDKYYLTYGSHILADYKAMGGTPSVLMGVLDLAGPKPWPLKEYSNKLVNDLTTKFKQEKPNLGTDIIQSYINRFAQIKDSPRVTEKDITKYNWKDLETTVDANQPKRIKAGKINDGEPSKDANLVYNQNGLRIYAGKTKNACIKYGNGYPFCISARGEDNMYNDYRYEQEGTPYFVFDDTKSSERDENGNFKDITHLLVIFVYKNPELDDDYYFNDEHILSSYYYTVTTANNPGEDRYGDFPSVESDYPELKGLENIFKPVESDPKEKAENNLKTKYNKALDKLTRHYYEELASDDDYYVFTDITTVGAALKSIDSYRVLKGYTEKVKQISDEYRNELTKLKLMKEGLERKTKLTESETATIHEFIKYAIKNLEIQKPPRNLTLSYDNEAAKEKRSFGYFDPNDNKIWVYCGNRNMADILRTLAHELVHRKQDEDGRIDYESGKTGSEIENEANAQAGILLRDFGKQHEEIYQ